MCEDDRADEEYEGEGEIVKHGADFHLPSAIPSNIDELEVPWSCPSRTAFFSLQTQGAQRHSEQKGGSRLNLWSSCLTAYHLRRGQ